MRDSCDTGACSRRSQFIHIALFWNAGWPGWAGFLVVVQNVVSSLFNSHLFDFVEGWIYVLGVGIAGGMSLGARRRSGKSPGLPVSGAPAAVLINGVSASSGSESPRFRPTIKRGDH